MAVYGQYSDLFMESAYAESGALTHEERIVTLARAAGMADAMAQSANNWQEEKLPTLEQSIRETLRNLATQHDWPASSQDLEDARSLLNSGIIGEGKMLSILKQEFGWTNARLECAKRLADAFRNYEATKLSMNAQLSELGHSALGVAGMCTDDLTQADIVQPDFVQFETRLAGVYVIGDTDDDAPAEVMSQAGSDTEVVEGRVQGDDEKLPDVVEGDVVEGDVIVDTFDGRRVNSLLTLLQNRGVHIGDMSPEFFDGCAFGDLEKLFRSGYESRLVRNIEPKPWHSSDMIVMINRLYLAGLSQKDIRAQLLLGDYTVFPDYQIANTFQTFIKYAERGWHKDNPVASAEARLKRLEEFIEASPLHAAEAVASETTSAPQPEEPVSHIPENIEPKEPPTKATKQLQELSKPLPESLAKKPFAELDLPAQRMIVAQKLEDVIGLEGARRLLDGRIGLFSQIENERIHDLRDSLFSELGIQPEVAGKDGVLRQLIERRLLTSDQLRRVSWFIGFRIEANRATQIRTIKKDHPKSVGQIRKDARVANLAETDLLIGLNAMMDYIDDKTVLAKLSR